MGDESSTSSGPSGVGLSDPTQSASRRKILEVIYRMRATGYVTLNIQPLRPIFIVVQSWGGYGFAHDRRCWLAERGEIVVDRIDIGNHPSTSSRYLHQVIPSSFFVRSGSHRGERCPTECRLSYSDNPWSCKVVLTKTFDKDGQPVGSPQIIPFGAVITEKSRVEERIRRAQRAILNPSTGYETFLLGPDEDPDEKELSFSKNCVCLELSGPDLTDLSFCDLPGTCPPWCPVVPSPKRLLYM